VSAERAQLRALRLLALVARPLVGTLGVVGAAHDDDLPR